MIIEVKIIVFAKKVNSWYFKVNGLIYQGLCYYQTKSFSGFSLCGSNLCWIYYVVMKPISSFHLSLYIGLKDSGSYDYLYLKNKDSKIRISPIFYNKIDAPGNDYALWYVSSQKTNIIYFLQNAVVSIEYKK